MLDNTVDIRHRLCDTAPTVTLAFSMTLENSPSQTKQCSAVTNRKLSPLLREDALGSTNRVWTWRRPENNEVIQNERVLKVLMVTFLVDLKQWVNTAEKGVLPLICISMRFLYGTALLLDICSEMLTLRRLTLLKFSLLARPANAASEYSDVLFAGMKNWAFYTSKGLQGHANNTQSASLNFD